MCVSVCVRVCLTYLNLLPCTVVSGRKINHLLHFVTRPVRVFPKDYSLPLSGGRQSHEGVTGTWVHFGTEIP